MHKISSLILSTAILLTMYSCKQPESTEPPASIRTTLETTCITIYKTFVTGECEQNDYSGQSGSSNTVTLKNTNHTNLIFPGTSTAVTMKKWEFWNVHLEGSAFVFYNNNSYIINLENPDPNADEDNPASANPDSATFIFAGSSIKWGLDAQGNDLKPWHTIAVKQDGPIPAGSRVYIPSLDGVRVPVAKLGHLTNNNGNFYNPETQPSEFDWFIHDGWVVATDTSWSLPSSIEIKDRRWLDLYTGVASVYDWIQDNHDDMIHTETWHNKKEYTTVIVHP